MSVGFIVASLSTIANKLGPLFGFKYATLASSSAIILDAYRKGLKNFDVQTAYAGIRKNLTEGFKALTLDAETVGRQALTLLAQCVCATPGRHMGPIALTLQ